MKSTPNFTIFYKAIKRLTTGIHARFFDSIQRLTQMAWVDLSFMTIIVRYVSTFQTEKLPEEPNFENEIEFDNKKQSKRKGSDCYHLADC